MDVLVLLALRGKSHVVFHSKRKRLSIFLSTCWRYHLSSRPWSPPPREIRTRQRSRHSHSCFLGLPARTTKHCIRCAVLLYTCGSRPILIHRPRSLSLSFPIAAFPRVVVSRSGNRWVRQVYQLLQNSVRPAVHQREPRVRVHRHQPRRRHSPHGRSGTAASWAMHVRCVACSGTRCESTRICAQGYVATLQI